MISCSLKKIFNELDVQEKVALAPFSTMKTGGAARYFLKVKNEQQLAMITFACFENSLKMHILSGGSNTLFSDLGFDGLVIKLSEDFDYIKKFSENIFEVGASTSYAKLSKHCLALGVSSALGWLGTPGLVGGAVRMNAGSSLGVIGDIVCAVEGYLFGEKIVLAEDALCFSYRKSSIPKDFIVTKVFIDISKSIITDPNILYLQAAALKERRLKTQPREHSLGSFFKNPLPNYAGNLIERVGLKGYESGPAQISPIHANFIINRGGATTNQIINLASIAKKNVFENFGIELETEARFVGNESF